MKRRIMMILSIVMVFTSCSGVDNYKSPNGGIRGKIIDKITDKTLQAQQPDGFTVKLFEKGWSSNSPIDIPAKPDGTFENSFIFQDEYKVIPTQGAFFSPDTQEVQVGRNTEVNFKVMPYLAVTDVKITSSKGSIAAEYRIVRDKIGDKISGRRTLISKIPTVNSVSFDFQSKTDLSDVPDTEILDASYNDKITGLTSGKMYYIRIAVRTDNKYGRYNYSKTDSVRIP